MTITDKHILKACYYPAFQNAADMTRCRRQADWHLAGLGNNINVTFSKTESAAKASAKSADILFFWKKDAYWAAKASHRRKGLVVDEYAQQSVGDALDAFVSGHVTSQDEGHAQNFFKTVKTRRPLITDAILIGSGPDIDAVKHITSEMLERTLSIYLSTSILNEAVCAACPPDIIIAVDGPSQFGPSETGDKYRKRAAELVRQYKSLILVPAQYLPSIRAHWPSDIQDNIYAVPLTRKVTFGHRFKSEWCFEPTSNVLTSFGLPCAASFTDTIKLAGITLEPNTGKINPNTHHWEHKDEALYQRHIASMLAMHPASGQENTEYLTRHHARLSQDLSAYAASGISFSKWGQDKLEIKPEKSAANTAQRLPLKIRIFEVITKAQHYPAAIIISAFILAGLLGTTLQYSIGLHMLGFIITGGVAACLVTGFLFLRLRMNRMTARLERKLSQQQAQQFSNLSERLEALERKK